MNATLQNHSQASWFVMRDLKRPNAKQPAYQYLQEKNIRVFTPMKWQLSQVNGKCIRREVPYVQDLLFVHEERKLLDPIVESVPTLQYRWLRHTWREPMTVPDAEMDRFIRAAQGSSSPKYFMPEEITPAMLRRRIRIIGGLLDGCEGTLLTVRGSKVKRLLVQSPDLLAVAVEVNPEYIQLL